MECRKNFDNYLARYNDATPHKPGFISFNKNGKEQFLAYQSLIDEIESLIKRELFSELNHIRLDSVKSIDHTMERMNLALCTWIDKNRDEENDKIKRLTNLNINSDYLKETTGLLYAIIAKINQLDIFISKRECNTNVFVTQINFIDNTIIDLQNVLQVLEQNNAAIEKEKFMVKLDKKDRAFIEKISELPVSEWENEFDKYFTPLLIKALQHPLVIKDDKLLADVVEDQRVLAQGKKDRLIYNVANIFNLNAMNLKKSNSKLYKHFFSHSQFNKKDFYKNDLEELKKIYPIEIKLSKGDTSEVIVEYNGLKAPQYFSVLEEDNTITQEEITIPISQVHIANQYDIASSLAQALCDYVKNIEIYQLPSANIICLLPEKNEEIILDKLYHYGVKRIRPVYSLLDSVKDSILGYDRKQYLIIMNGLLDQKYPENLFYQKDLIKKFELIGYQVISIWSVDLLNDANEVWDDLIEQLGVRQLRIVN
jgi:hypothetical protein